MGVGAMSIQPPLTELDIETASLGFYEGFSIVVTIRSKVAIGTLILWAVVFPEGAGSALKGIRGTIDANTGSWLMVHVCNDLLHRCLSCFGHQLAKFV